MQASVLIRGGTLSNFADQNYSNVLSLMYSAKNFIREMII